MESIGSKRWPERGQFGVRQVNRLVGEETQSGFVRSASSPSQICILQWQLEQKRRTKRITSSLSKGSFVSMANTIPNPEFTEKYEKTRNTKWLFYHPDIWGVINPLQRNGRLIPVALLNLTKMNVCLSIYWQMVNFSMFLVSSHSASLLSKWIFINEKWELPKINFNQFTRTCTSPDLSLLAPEFKCQLFSFLITIINFIRNTGNFAYIPFVFVKQLQIIIK